MKADEIRGVFGSADDGDVFEGVGPRRFLLDEHADELDVQIDLGSQGLDQMRGLRPHPDQQDSQPGHGRAMALCAASEGGGEAQRAERQGAGEEPEEEDPARERVFAQEERDEGEDGERERRGFDQGGDRALFRAVDVVVLGQGEEEGAGKDVQQDEAGLIGVGHVGCVDSVAGHEEQREEGVQQGEVGQRTDEAFHHREHIRSDAAEHDADPHEQLDPERVPRAVVLLEELIHRLVEENHIIEIVLLRAFALVVDDGCGRHVVDAISRQGDPITQVDVFPVHEEAFIETVERLKHIGSAEHEGTR